MKIQYVYFSPDGSRREQVLSYERARKMIGDRVLTGFEMVARYVDCQDGSDAMTIVYFQSDVTGRVWALYYS